MFLENNPQYVGKIVLFLHSPISSADEDQQKMRQATVHINRINSIYGSVESPAIQHICQELTLEEGCAISSIANVYVVSNVRGGMDLSPYEYIICRERKKDARLILSVLSNTSTCLAGTSLSLYLYVMTRCITR